MTNNGLGPRLGRNSEAGRAGHSAKVPRGATVAGRAAGDAAVVRDVPVDEKNLGFHQTSVASRQRWPTYLTLTSV